MIVGISIANVIIAVALTQPFTRGIYDDFLTVDSITVIYRYHFCESPNIVSGVFFAILYVYGLIIVVLNIYLASKLRHINQKQFKNTKEVNILIVLAFVLNMCGQISNVILKAGDSSVNYLLVIQYCVIICTGIICQMILFLPKAFVIVKENII